MVGGMGVFQWAAQKSTYRGIIYQLSDHVVYY